MKATVTATASANGYQQRAATAHNARTICGGLGYVRPESGRSFDNAVPPRTWPARTDPCPGDVSELPSIANDRHWQQPANMKLRRALNPRATHGNTLVMPSSLGGDDDQGAEVPAVPSAAGCGAQVTWGLTNRWCRRDSTYRKGGRSEQHYLYLRISRSPSKVARGGLLPLPLLRA
jgi:hypothetical protein